ncbi:hypothetical protein [Rosenbergiella collisarenosi]|nr:hypothetical protein [Rosenbergiella collisarenosi]
MNYKKIFFILLFLFMAIGGVGGVALIGYSIILGK